MVLRYTVAAEELFLAQRALWRGGSHSWSRGLTGLSTGLDSALVVEQWHLTKPLAHALSQDGLHFHSLLRREAIPDESHAANQGSGSGSGGSPGGQAALASGAGLGDGVDAGTGQGGEDGEGARVSGCRCAAGSPEDGWYRYSGPPLMHLLKVIANALVFDDESPAVRPGRKEAAMLRHQKWHADARY